MTQATYSKANLIAQLRSSFKDYDTVTDFSKKTALKKRIEGLHNELKIPFNEAELN